MGKSPGLRKRIALSLFTKLYAQQVARHELRTLFWECTLRCNLACRHCGSDCRVDTQQKDMPAKDFFRVLDTQITPHVDPHRVLVILSGGEVLVRADLERIGLELYKREYPWGIVTNGLALDEKRFETQLRAGLHSITVSLDGFAEEHNYLRGNPRSFDTAWRAARMVAAEKSVASDVVTCVNARTLPRLKEFRDMLLDGGIRSWRIFTIFPVGRAAEDPSLQLSDEQFTALMEFIAHTRKEGKIDISYGCEGFLGGYEAEVRDRFYQCQAGISVASIRVDGAISGCTSIRSNFHQGNIYTDDFWEVWQNRFDKFRNREWAYKGICANCKWFKYCLGNGMHLYGNDEELLLCHYNRLVR